VKRLGGDGYPQEAGLPEPQDLRFSKKEHVELNLIGIKALMLIKWITHHEIEA
jgi:hypothetical protein